MRTRTAARVIAEALEIRSLLSAYFVSPSGSDSAAGTSDAPWKTLQRAADSVHAGDVVTVRAGTYSSGFHLESSGTAAARITFQANPGAVITGRNATTPDAINLEGADYVTIKGFTIDNRATGAITRAGIRSVINTNAIIRDNTVHAPGRWGIFTGFSENVLIENNEANRAGQEHGIYVSNSADNPTIRGNLLWGNRACGIHMNGDLSQGGDGIISGALVENNVIYDNGVGGGSAINGDGLQNSVIRNNVLYNNHASGISLYQIDGGAGAKNNTVVNNTILVAADGRWALNISDGSTGNVVFNNIFYNHGTYRGSITISPDSLSGFKSDHNVVMDRFTTDDGDSRLTLAQWRSSTGQDAHSKIAAPAQLFVDAAGNDYRLVPGAPAVDAGVATFNGKNAPVKDFEAQARPSGSAVDIGADEVAGTTPDPTPGTWTQTTVADFNGGTSTNLAILNVAGGELRLRSGASSEFNGRSLSPGWSVARAGSVKPSATESGGSLSVGAAHVSSGVVPLMALAGRVRFDAATAQQFGLATGLDAAAGNSWAVFSTLGTTNKLYARVNVRGVVRNVALGARPSGFHEFRVEPHASGVKFYVDGMLKANVKSVLPATAGYRVFASAKEAAKPLKVDWARMAKFASSGTFVSSVRDAGKSVTWGALSYGATIPAGTVLKVETMSGNTASPNASWSAWAQSAGGQAASPAGRYIRYRLTLGGSGGTSPVLSDLSITCA